VCSGRMPHHAANLARVVRLARPFRASHPRRTRRLPDRRARQAGPAADPPPPARRLPGVHRDLPADLGRARPALRPGSRRVGLRRADRSRPRALRGPRRDRDPGRGGDPRPPGPGDPVHAAGRARRPAPAAAGAHARIPARLDRHPDRGGEIDARRRAAHRRLPRALALAEKQPPEPELWDLTARARAEKANAWRLLGYTAEAIEQLELARTEALQGTGDPRLIAEIASLEASVFIAARQFERAEELLDLLEDRYRQEGDMAALG